jgi:hypothetical protein
VFVQQMAALRSGGMTVALAPTSQQPVTLLASPRSH